MISLRHLTISVNLKVLYVFNVINITFLCRIILSTEILLNIIVNSIICLAFSTVKSKNAAISNDTIKNLLHM